MNKSIFLKQEINGEKYKNQIKKIKNFFHETKTVLK